MEVLHLNTYKRLPRHIGIIPDGNRRWALENGYDKQDGYENGIKPGIELYNRCLELGIKEITFYGFTQDNTKRPAIQTEAFRKACVDSVMQLAQLDAELLIVGNTKSPLFPKDLIPFTKRVKFGKGLIKVNFLVNYGWDWDLNHSQMTEARSIKSIASKDISRIDLIIRWGGRRRLSGFLPIQSIYSDFYVLDDYWPDFKVDHLDRALEWYQLQDVTLGG
jgi:undecaprenyl diphosphate synthase